MSRTGRIVTLLTLVGMVGGIALVLGGIRDRRPTGDDAPAAIGLMDRVRIEVLNAGGVPGAARRATEMGRDAGFDVVFYGNAASFDRVASEVVDRVGRPEVAETVARVLGISNVRTERDSTRYVEVSVILGSRWGSEEAPGTATEP